LKRCHLSILKTPAALSAAALLALALTQPASANVLRQYVVTADAISVPGGSIACESGCTVTINSDGSEQIDTGNGDSYWSDGTDLYGAP
jgi:hypothetical protein